MRGSPFDFGQQMYGLERGDIQASRYLMLMSTLSATNITWRAYDMAEVQIYNPATLGAPLGQYSHVTRVKASEFLFIAGMLAPGEDFDTQCTGVFAQIEKAL